jgi:hypothetical protein
MDAAELGAAEGHMEAIKVLAELGANKDARDVNGATALHYAGQSGHMVAIKVLAELGAQVDAQDAHGETPLQASSRLGHHQAAQLLRQLRCTARTRKAAATSWRAQQAARQDTPETREQADRMAAALIEEGEREEAQRKVRGVELAPVRGVSDAMSLVHEWVASSEAPAAFLWWRLSAQCVMCSGGGRSRSSCRRPRPRAERVEGRPAKRRRRGAAASRRARRVGKPAAPARYHQQALATAAR